MRLPGRWQPPSSSLPPVRSLGSTSEDRIDSALRNLHAIYCPLRLPTSISQQRSKEPGTDAGIVDSGYVSEDDYEHDTLLDTEDALAALRADVFERDCAVRWVTGLIARADELCFTSEETRDRIIDEAASLLSSFSDAENDATPEPMTRDFSFPTAFASPTSIDVRLNDAPLSGTDHTDVGLQSWGASIILSGLMCASPNRFALDKLQPGATIIELGAGTGLVSLTLAALHPHISSTAPAIIATDYHPAVLDNLRSNIAVNFPENAEPPVHTMLLDWSRPTIPHEPVSMLVAADAVYDPEHAGMLRDCAARLLKQDGIFWLIVTVRVVGKFEGIADTVEAAFVDEQCPRREDFGVLKILQREWLEKQRGIGRGDETGYRLYRIGWADA